MKHLLLFLLFPAVCSAQKITIDTCRFVYTDVRQAENVPSAILQSRARLFLFDRFDSLGGIKFDDLDARALIVNCVLPLKIQYGKKETDSTDYGYIYFSTRLRFKDGKFSYNCYNFYHESGNGTLRTGGWLASPKPKDIGIPMETKNWQKVKVSGDRLIKKFIDEMVAAIENDETDSWN